MENLTLKSFCVTLFVIKNKGFAMDKSNKIFWLDRRLKELGKNKVRLAEILGIGRARLSEMENGRWKLQTEHIKKTAEFLEFDRMAFLDFLSGDISEDELWNSKPQEKISEEDLALLRAVKTFASRPQAEDQAQNPAQSAALPPKDKERSR